MSELLGSIWWLLVALGLLITFHEFGHFWVARRLGVKVLRFSVGFGSALYRTSSDLFAIRDGNSASVLRSNPNGCCESRGTRS